MEIEVESLRELPAGFEALAAASVREGYRHLVRLGDDWASGENRFDGPGEVLFAAHAEGRLVGVCGLNRDPFATDGSVGRVRRLYVSPDARRRGVARLLVARVLARAQGYYVSVRLRTNDPGAMRFYEAIGFERVDSPDATHEIDPSRFPA